MALAAVGQITSTSSMTHNLAQCRTIIQKAVAAKAKAVFLPEASDYIAKSSQESISLAQPTSKSPFVLGLQEDAKKHALSISVGIHEPSDDSKRVRNTLVWIDENGEIAYRYQKIHMFDVDIQHGPRIKESDFTETCFPLPLNYLLTEAQPGTDIIPPFESTLGRIGSMICYDLRFPEISLRLKRQGADILLYPSAFTIPTGQAHWLPLLRARAIETQCFVFAAAQVGHHNEKRASYGHSIILDPWGEVLAELSGDGKDEPEVIFAEIDLNKISMARQQIPLPRRTDVYPEL